MSSADLAWRLEQLWTSAEGTERRVMVTGDRDGRWTVDAPALTPDGVNVMQCRPQPGFGMLQQVHLRLQSVRRRIKPAQIVSLPAVVTAEELSLGAEVCISRLARRSNPPVRLELLLRSTEPLLQLTRDGEPVMVADGTDGLGGLLRIFDRLQLRWSSPELEEVEAAVEIPPPRVQGMWAVERWVDGAGRTCRWVSIHLPRFEGPASCIVGTTVADGFGPPRTNFSPGREPLSALVSILPWLDWPLLVDDLVGEVLVQPTLEWMGAWSEGPSPKLAEIGPLEPIGSGLWRIFAAVDGVELSFVERTPILALTAATQYLQSFRYRSGAVVW